MEIYSASDLGIIYTCLLYFCLGIISLFCNMLNISVWVSNRELRKKYFYLMALDFFEITNAISYVVVGIGRGLTFLDEKLWTITTPRKCFFEKYWPHTLILGTQLPSFGIILIASERLCAVLQPTAYNRYFTGHSKLVLLAMVPIAGSVSLLIGGLSTIGDAGNELIGNQLCTIVASTAKWYSTFHYVFIVFAYSISFVAIFVVRRTLMRSTIRKVRGDNNLGVMLLITGSSIILVGFESLGQILLSWKIAGFSDILYSTAHAMPACLSIMNTTTNFTLRPEYRKQFIFLLRRDRKIFKHTTKTTNIHVLPKITVTNQ